MSGVDVGRQPLPNPSVAKVDNPGKAVDHQRLVTPDGRAMNQVTQSQHQDYMGKRPKGSSREHDMRQQMLTNQVLRSDLEDHEERLHRQHTRVQETATAQQHDFQLAHAQGNQLLNKQQEGTLATHLPELSAQEMVEQLGLQVRWDELQGLRARMNDSHHCDFFFTSTLRDLLNSRGNARREHKLSEDLKKVQDHNLNADFIRTAHELYELSMSKPMDVQAILKLLQQSDPIIKQLKKRLDQTNAHRLQALHERMDMAAAESLHNEMDDILEDLVTVHLERLDLLLNSGQGEAFLERVSDCAKFMVKLLEDGRTDNDDLLRRLTSDLDGLDHEQKDRQRQKDEDDLNMQRLQSRCQSQLVDNSKRQHEIFGQIASLYGELTGLGDERKGIIDDLVNEKDQHEERNAMFERFGLTSREHQQLLEDLVRRLEITQETYDSFEGFMNSSRDNISKATDLARQQTADILLKEQRDYYSEFRAYYTLMGELMYAKERRLEETEDHMECLHQKIEVAQECLDAKVQTYREQLRDLERSKQRDEVDMDELRERADKAAEDAQATEEALMLAGDKIISPLIELQEVNHDKQAGILAKRKRVAQKKKQVLDDQEQTSLRNKQMAKQARVSGLSSHMRPLSPDPSKYKHKPVAQLTAEEKRQQSADRRKSYVDRVRQLKAEEDPSSGGTPNTRSPGISVGGGSASRSFGNAG